ncbi:MAG: hypothetical protein ACTMII_10840 [Brachybacterium sp.]|uniref:hypothetical protein n=1 Tax=unclassified Brachybacterium TaxID=2623841 RepID=UPI003F92F0F3
MRTSQVARGLALLGGLAMVLSACTLPPLPGFPGSGGGGGGGGSAADSIDLTHDDVITYTSHQMAMEGDFGDEVVEIHRDRVVLRFELPDDSVLFEVETELEPEQRARVEQAAEAYLEWEPTVPDSDRDACTDIGSDIVEISGSITHRSTMQNCQGETPLAALSDEAREAVGRIDEHLARPWQQWTVEIRPWDESLQGADEATPPERYSLDRGWGGEGMLLTATNTPEGWGAEVDVEQAAEGVLLSWAQTGTVLTAVNEVHLERRSIGCGDPTGEMRIIRAGEPAALWTHRVCPGDVTEDLATVLRAL